MCDGGCCRERDEGTLLEMYGQREGYIGNCHSLMGLKFSIKKISLTIIENNRP
jgi:hypothetical protein